MNPVLDTDKIETIRGQFPALRRELECVGGWWSFKTRKGLKAAIRFETRTDAQRYVDALHAYYEELGVPTRMVIIHLIRDVK